MSDAGFVEPLTPTEYAIDIYESDMMCTKVLSLLRNAQAIDLDNITDQETGV